MKNVRFLFDLIAYHMVAGILKVPFPVLILQSKLKVPIKSGFCNSLIRSQTAFSRKKLQKRKEVISMVEYAMIL